MSLRSLLKDLAILQDEVRNNTIPSLKTLIEDIDEWARIFYDEPKDHPVGFDVTLRSWCNRLRELNEELEVRT